MNYKKKNIILLKRSGVVFVSKKLKIEKSRKKQKWNLINCTENLLETDMLCGAQIEILGNNKITIDGCYGVFEYKDTYLKLKLAKGSIIICGSGFEIIFFEKHLITVKGKISSLEFCV